MDHVYRWADGNSTLATPLVGAFVEFEHASVHVFVRVRVSSQASADAHTCG